VTEIAYGWAPITKVEDQPDGTVIVHGPMTDAGLDRDQQRFTQPWLDQAVPRWFNESGNIREQHDGKRAAGAALVVKRDEATGRWDLSAHVVDPVAVLKVKSKTYKGFSIGVKEPNIVYGKADAPGGEIDGGYICETSLVDRPSNPRSLFTMVKADDAGAPVLVEDPHVEDLDDDGADDAAVDKVEDAGKHQHAPAGSPQGGQFTATDSSDSGLEQGHTKPPHGTHAHVKAGGKGKSGGSAKAKKTTAAMSYDPGKNTGTKGPEVKALQEALARLGVTDNAGKNLTASGSYGPETVQAVNKLQAALGMTANGKVTPALLKRIVALKQLPTKRVKKTDEPDLVKFVSAAQRRKDADSGVAMANGDFPIPDRGHLESAIGHLGDYTGDKAAARRHIIARARALGLVSMLPDGWHVSKADELLDHVDYLVDELLDGLDAGDVDQAEVAKYDEAGDIAGAREAIACIAALIQSEAAELAGGRDEELRDITILTSAVEALQYFIERETKQAEVEPDEGTDDAPANPGQAADDYNMAGAVTVKTDEQTTTEPAATETADVVKTDTPEPDLAKVDVPAIIKAAVAEVATAYEKRLETLEAQLTKALAQPEPGGPVQMRTGSQQALAKARETETVRAQIADYMQKADQIGNNDPTLAGGYRARAEQLERTLTG
jgi:hypothetical protein